MALGSVIRVYMKKLLQAADFFRAGRPGRFALFLMARGFGVTGG